MEINEFQFGQHLGIVDNKPFCTFLNEISYGRNLLEPWHISSALCRVERYMFDSSSVLSCTSY